MKKLAGRDFEDLLQVNRLHYGLFGTQLSFQCAIPVFEGLLPSPHNEIVLDALFVLASWHACAKLRLHTDHTLNFLEKTTATLGVLLRCFTRLTCASFKTTELPRESAARRRRRAANAKQSTVNPPNSTTGASPTTKPKGPKLKFFNLNTVKFHSLGHYAETIRRFGTTDSYSTQIVCLFVTLTGCKANEKVHQGELEHRRVKKFFSRTNKKQYQRQIAKHEQRERRLHQMRMGNQPTLNPSVSSTASSAPALAPHDLDPLPFTDPAVHYHMSQSQRNYIDITSWLADNKQDPALKVIDKPWLLFNH